MNILDDFIRDNRRIEILSNGGNPLQIPESWGKVLGDSDILVAIPDMHMHRHDSQLDSFSAGAAPMFEFLMHLEILKHRLVCVGKNLEVIQIGDYYNIPRIYIRTTDDISKYGNVSLRPHR